jgi:hypothetical protein
MIEKVIVRTGRWMDRKKIDGQMDGLERTDGQDVGQDNRTGQCVCDQWMNGENF